MNKGKKSIKLPYIGVKRPELNDNNGIVGLSKIINKNKGKESTKPPYNKMIRLNDNNHIISETSGEGQDTETSGEGQDTETSKKRVGTDGSIPDNISETSKKRVGTEQSIPELPYKKSNIQLNKKPKVKKLKQFRVVKKAKAFHEEVKKELNGLKENIKNFLAKKKNQEILRELKTVLENMDGILKLPPVEAREIIKNVSKIINKPQKAKEPKEDIREMAEISSIVRNASNKNLVKGWRPKLNDNNEIVGFSKIILSRMVPKKEKEYSLEDKNLLKDNKSQVVDGNNL